MIRLAICLACAGLLLTGCDGRTAANKPAVESPKKQAQVQRKSPREGDDDEPQTPIVRALIDTIDEIDEDAADEFDSDENNDVKKQLKRSLREADKELRNVLGENSKRKILQANKKPPIPVVGVPKPPATKPEAKQKDGKEKPEDGKEKPKDAKEESKPAAKEKK